jgi:hypothetical protein
MRGLSYFSFFGNYSTNMTDFDSQLVKAQDVTVDAVLTSFYFNTIVFVLLMASYEVLRRLLPTVYSARKKLDRTQPDRPGQSQSDDRLDAASGDEDDQDTVDSAWTTLPDTQPFDWVGPVFGVPWSRVRQTAGLDGYFFLRYIRMNVRITAGKTLCADDSVLGLLFWIEISRCSDT